MNYSPILIVAGEPNSIFFEIFFKSLKKIKPKSPLIIVGSLKTIKMQMKSLKFKKNIKTLNEKNFLNSELSNKQINLINVNYNSKKAFEKISSKTNNYIDNCFNIAIKLIKKYNLKKFINGPINKKTFLNKNYYGITEYLTKKFKVKKYTMLIYNEKLAVCPLTTHVPLKLVPKKISKKLIVEKIKIINDFYKLRFNKKPKFAILGLNPHCESTDNFNEDEKIIRPAVKQLRKNKFIITGPLSADTIFLSQNRKKYDVIIGMYHDQVLTPMKTIYEYNAINITLGLPFTRISPDHGPNEKMMGKNISNPLSLIKAINFLDKN